MRKRRYKLRVINKGWFKKGNIPHTFGKPLPLITRKKLSMAVREAMKRLPEDVKKRIKKNQFKKGHHYAHWTGKYGEKHPRYKGIAYRNKVFSLKKKQCEKCGKNKFKSLRHLHIHHRDGNRRNQNIKNLRVLCSKCHLKMHKNWEYRWGKSS